MISAIAINVVEKIDSAGRFSRFFWNSILAGIQIISKSKAYPLIWTQIEYIGIKSIPVIMITGTFVGVSLALQAYETLAGNGLEEYLGVLINIPVVKELGPVLAAMMLAGRVGGALTAELGTMNVTEQIDAVRSMGTDPIKHLVAPRMVACIVLTPLLIIYADLMGIIGGFFISVYHWKINSNAYWFFSASGVEMWDVGVGVMKGLFFGLTISLISCYKGFTCKEGAQGVGKACTEAFVACFVSILVIDTALVWIFMALYKTFYPVRSLF